MPSCRRFMLLRRSCSTGPASGASSTIRASGNPTRKNLETTIASLEGGCGALAFATGMAATHCVIQSLAAATMSSRRRISTAARIGCCTRSQTASGIKFTHVDTTNSANVAAAITPATRLVWIESPGNPLMSITDIAGVCRGGPPARGAARRSTARSPRRC